MPRAFLLFATLVCCAPWGAAAQRGLTRSQIAWESVTTEHFRVHYPVEMREWVMAMAPNLESYAQAVHQLVGSEPRARTTVLVDDPNNQSNGFAVPLLNEPVVFLWPTPPNPGPSFGMHRGWGEVLAIHEYGHIVHLTVPSRNLWDKRLWRRLPAQLSPVARKSPAWVIEGYATLIEGQLTGNGRPHSAGRAAILRQWALEGRLPAYAQLNTGQGFMAGAMRYLVGSAYLEWLADRKGDESLRNLWRRMTARQARSFVEAFRGVYGAPPDELYGVFTTELVEKALTARSGLRSSGLIEGDLVQRLTGSTGEPAVSKDGAHVAVVLRSPSGPSRLVVWGAGDEPVDSATMWERRRMLERDPLDVAPFDSQPPTKKVIASLAARGGRSHENPRWFADGERLLVSRDEPTGDGSSRPDVFIWNRKGGLRRVTRGAGIRAADPAPNGTWAAAVRCHAGICSLVRLDLASGSWTVIAAGTPTTVWHRPRVSPDGSRIAASRQSGGRWSVVVVDANSGGLTAVGDAATNRYAPSWTRDGGLVAVSEAQGIPNLDILDPSSGATRAISRVLGAAVSPDVGPDNRIWYLSLHARGYDLRRFPAQNAVLAAAKPLDTTLAPVLPNPETAGLTFAPRAVEAPRRYGFGPRGWRFLPGFTFGPDGDLGLAMLSNSDPVGKWTTVIQGGAGQRGAANGASLASAFRAAPLHFEVNAWYSDHQPSRQRAGGYASSDIDGRYRGAGLAASWRRDRGGYGISFAAGGSVGEVTGTHLESASRAFGFGESRVRLSWERGRSAIVPEAWIHHSQGSTSGEEWTRQVQGAALRIGGSAASIRVEGIRGRVTEAGPGEFGRAFESFAAGGGSHPFIAPPYWSQRIPLAAVPVGIVAGSRFEMLRASAQVAGLSPYVAWIGAGDSVAHYNRVFGVEQQFETGGFGFVRLPIVQIRAGVGYSLDRPYAEKLRPYVGVTYRP